MRSEFNLFGVFIPGLLCAGLMAWLVNVLMRRILRHTGFYRLVWHRALFDLALFVIILGGIVWLGAATGWQ